MQLIDRSSMYNSENHPPKKNGAKNGAAGIHQEVIFDAKEAISTVKKELEQKAMEIRKERASKLCNQVIIRLLRLKACHIQGGAS